MTLQFPVIDLVRGGLEQAPRASLVSALDIDIVMHDTVYLKIIEATCIYQ